MVLGIIEKAAGLPPPVLVGPCRQPVRRPRRQNAVASLVNACVAA